MLTVGVTYNCVAFRDGQVSHFKVIIQSAKRIVI
jgi:hypothetical protein